MAKKKLSPKRAYHKRWQEQQKVLREEAKERRAIKKEQHELRMKLQAEGRHEEIKQLLPPEEERKRRLRQKLEYENGFNPDGSFDADRYYWMNIRED